MGTGKARSIARCSPRILTRPLRGTSPVQSVWLHLNKDRLHSQLSLPSLSSPQVLNREGPLPLILLPQFGGYWIEGTNHDLASIPEAELLQSPVSKVKLECNHMARIYRKHFLGKVRPTVPPAFSGSLIDQVPLSYSSD